MEEATKCNQGTMIALFPCDPDSIASLTKKIASETNLVCSVANINTKAQVFIKFFFLFIYKVILRGKNNLKENTSGIVKLQLKAAIFFLSFSWLTTHFCIFCNIWTERL